MVAKKIIGIVGSGLTSLACTSKLLEDSSIKIIIIDNAKKFSDDSNTLKENIKNQEKYIDRLKLFYNFIRNVKNEYSVNKTYFGETIFNEKLQKNSNYKLFSSKTYGGFSNVWGGVCNYPFEDEIKDWPLSYNELSQYFKEIAKILNITSNAQSFADFSQFDYIKEYGFKISPTANNWHEQILKEKKSINNDNIFFGRTNLSINPKLKNELYCIECGMCMHGCPHDIIFNSRYIFDHLQKEKLIEYKGDLEALRFEEKEDKAILYAKDHNDNKIKNFHFDYLFIATGCLNSTKIIINSFKELTNQSITINQNDNYVVPFYLKKIKSPPLEFNKNTQSQLSFFIKDTKIKNNGVYFQTYEFSDIVISNLLKKFSYNYFIHSIIKYFPFLNKILFAQFFFDSKNSSQIIIKKNDKNFEIVKIDKKNASNEYFKTILNKIDKNKYLKITFIKTFIKKYMAGSSLHLGSSFKMSEKNDIYSTDLLGRPYNYKKVSIVDSTILPSLPSNSHTFLTMTNCYRIVDKLFKNKKI